jgi:hypothetical protein
MPAKSEKQRRAMYAAAAGKSTLGIPVSVGKEFVGKAPKKKHHSPSGPDGAAEGSAQPGNGPTFPESAKSARRKEWGPQAGAGKSGPNG